MTRREIMKTAAALFAFPATLGASLRDAFAERRAMWQGSDAAQPVPVYVFDSHRRRMTEHAPDDTTRAMRDYLLR